MSKRWSDDLLGACYVTESLKSTQKCSYSGDYDAERGRRAHSLEDFDTARCARVRRCLRMSKVWVDELLGACYMR